MWDVAGKTCIVTGGGRGIGRQTALLLADRGARIVIAGRRNAASTSIVNELSAVGPGHEFVEVDLASLASVVGAADTLASHGPLGLLVANAGVAGPGPLTVDGFEPNFGINHLGHFGLAYLLSGPLAGGRLVVVSSNAHFDAEAHPLASARTRSRGTGFEAYRRSKLANVLFVREASKRWPEVVSVAVHPGMVATEIWRRVPQPIRWWMTRSMASPVEGAERVVFAATDDEAASGSYYDRDRIRPPSDRALDDEAARELWQASVEFLGLTH